jgi:hypothetical protein
MGLRAYSHSLNVSQVIANNAEQRCAERSPSRQPAARSKAPLF